MTLVLTALTRTHLVQASDRRVVRLQGSRIVASEDKRVKAILTPRHVVSYTGLAALGGKDSGEWLALVLGDGFSDADGGIERLRTALAAEMARMRRIEQPMSVVLAGWRKGPLMPLPVAHVITNQGPPGANLGAVEDILTAHFLERAPGRRCSIIAVGQPLHRGELQRLNATLERRSRVGRSFTARGVAQWLAANIRAVSASSDRGAFVSDDVLVVAVPRPDLIRRNFVAGRLIDDGPAAVAIDGGESLRRDTQGGPIIVGENGAVVRALTPEEGPPGEGVTVAMQLLRVPDSGDIKLLVIDDPTIGVGWSWPGVVGSPR